MRVQNYSTAFIPPPPFTLKLETKNITLLYGQRAEIIFSATGDAPDFITIKIKEESQQNYDDFRIRKDNQQNIYRYEIASVKTSMSFFGQSQ